MDEKLRARTNGPERAHATHDDHVPVLEASTWMFVPLVPLPTAEVSVWNRTVGRHRPAHLRHLGQLSKVSYLFRYMVLPRVSTCIKNPAGFFCSTEAYGPNGVWKLRCVA